jgi:hypothetical protein
MITGSTVITLVIIAILVYVIFFAPIRIPSWLRTIFGIVLAVVAFVWLLNLLGVVIF